VTTPNGTTAVNPADQFHYGGPPPQPPEVTAVSPATGSTVGGDQVTITGANLDGGIMQFGSTPAASASCGNTSCTAVTPPGPAGTVDVQVSTAGGTSPP